jgi:hypothetical protein
LPITLWIILSLNPVKSFYLPFLSVSSLTGRKDKLEGTRLGQPLALDEAEVVGKRQAERQITEFRKYWAQTIDAILDKQSPL